jgi:hypothetical protein
MVSIIVDFIILSGYYQYNIYVLLVEFKFFMSYYIININTLILFL